MIKDNILKKVMASLKNKSSTDPSLYKSPKKFNETELLAAIRQDIMAEYDAINLYSAHMDTTDDAELKKILSHIIKEEKEHAAELINYLDKKDKYQKEILEKEISKKDS